MIPTIEQIVEGVKAGIVTASQAVSWLHMHAEGSANELREHFAGLAMQGLIAHGDLDILSYGAVAKAAYELSDEMLKARNE
jgi:predicted alpha/beta-hydrolase family hydrolase